jgi:hypothetical protein
MNPKIVQNLFPAGAILVFISSVLQFQEVPYMPIGYTLGSIMLIAYHAFTAYNTTETTKINQRLYRIGFIASLFLAVGSYFMLTNSLSWVVTTLIYAVITFYLSFRLK